MKAYLSGVFGTKVLELYTKYLFDTKINIDWDVGKLSLLWEKMHIEKMLEHVSMERSGISLATHIKFW